MGLDSYFMTLEHWAPEEPVGGLVGGMCSGDGSDGSFRGKVYEPIFQLFNETLYQELADMSWVRDCAEALEDLYATFFDDPETQTVTIDDEEYTKEEFQNLVKLFRLAAEAGCVYHGWW